MEGLSGCLAASMLDAGQEEALASFVAAADDAGPVRAEVEGDFGPAHGGIVGFGNAHPSACANKPASGVGKFRICSNVLLPTGGQFADMPGSGWFTRSSGTFAQQLKGWAGALGLAQGELVAIALPTPGDAIGLTAGVLAGVGAPRSAGNHYDCGSGDAEPVIHAAPPASCRATALATSWWLIRGLRVSLRMTAVAAQRDLVLFHARIHTAIGNPVSRDLRSCRPSGRFVLRGLFLRQPTLVAGRGRLAYSRFFVYRRGWLVGLPGFARACMSRQFR